MEAFKQDQKEATDCFGIFWTEIQAKVLNGATALFIGSWKHHQIIKLS